MNSPTSHVGFVSLGPGDPELITLQSLRALEQADVIFCPGTQSEGHSVQSRAADLLRKLSIPSDKLRIFTLPMLRNRLPAQTAYRETATQVSEAYHNGLQTVVAVEGDASIYASIHYMMEHLEGLHVPTRQYCGIPSFIAATEPGRLLLTEQEDRLVVVPGNLTAEELDCYLRQGHVPVIMKLSRCKEMLINFIPAHPEYKYHYLENVSTPQEVYLCQPEEIIRQGFPYFSLMIVQHKGA